MANDTKDNPKPQDQRQQQQVNQGTSHSPPGAPGTRNDPPDSDKPDADKLTSGNKLQSEKR